MSARKDRSSLLPDGAVWLPQNDLIVRVVERNPEVTVNGKTLEAGCINVILNHPDFANVEGNVCFVEHKGGRCIDLMVPSSLVSSLQSVQSFRCGCFE